MSDITIDTSVLTAWYNARAGIPASSSSSTSTSPTAVKTPTPPWSSASTAPRSSALATSVMNGSRFIDPTAAKLDAPSKTQGSDYKNLFALYQGLNALEGLTEQAQAKGVGATALAAIQTRFAAGMQEVSSFLNAKPFSAFQVAEGTTGASESTTAGPTKETDAYQTSTLYQGDRNDEVPAFQGAVQFSLTVTRPGGAQVPVSFDLGDMGSTPRTMGNVAAYLNDQLKGAGLITRFNVVETPATAQVIKTGTSSYTLPAGADQFALKIKGDSTESLAFSAPATTPAVYVANSSGATSPALNLLKLDGDRNADPAPPVFATPLAAATAAARAVATSPDGSVYVLTDVTGPAADGQAIKGAQDVALNKYDSAGNLVYSRTLGAAANASGLALSVSADGSKVAVAGSVTGALDSGTTGASATTADSFVSVFNAAGEEQWTQRRGASDADQATGVAFGADGSVYVSGTASSAMPGATGVGGADGYLMGFSASGASTFATQFGTANGDKTSGVAVSGSSVFVAGVEGGDAVVRRYDLQSGSAPTLAATRDLGPLQGGDVAGIKIAADGSVIVAGSTHNGALSAGTVTTAYDGGRDAFVAKLDPGLQPSGADTLTYLGGDQDRTVTGLDVSGGQVWLTGQVAIRPPPGQTTAFNGYAAAIDAGSGAVGWSRTLQGADFTDAPTAISVAANGTSVLDQVGLPTGTIAYAPTTSLVGATALRAGDEFFVAGGGGSPQAVVIGAADTMDTLAAKIARASGFNATVTAVTTSAGVRTLKITPANPTSQLTLTAGPKGRDALATLGLTEGRIETATTATPKIGAPTANGKQYAIGLPTTLDLSSASAIKAAQSTLISAALKVKSIYTDMTTAVAKPTTATSGTVPTYLTNQIANYQAALQRLTGSSS